jgi:small subunit ribosomal protein S15
MADYLDREKTAPIIKEYGGTEENSGSVEAQVAIFTYRINHLSEHLKTNKKDHSCRRSLMKMVGKRRNLLAYLTKKDINGYRTLIARLGIRK